MTSLKEFVREVSSVALTHEDCTAGEDRAEGYIQQFAEHMLKFIEPIENGKVLYGCDVTLNEG